jgi:hypothetical protein
MYCAPNAQLSNVLRTKRACGCLGPTKPTHLLTSMSALSPLLHAQLTERVADALVVVLGDDDQSYISTAEVEERSKAYSVALMTALHVSGWRVCVCVCVCVCVLVWAVGHLCGRPGGLAHSAALMTALHVSGWRVCLRVCTCVGGWALVWAGWLAGSLRRSHDRTPREWQACVCVCGAANCAGIDCLQSAQSLHSLCCLILFSHLTHIACTLHFTHFSPSLFTRFTHFTHFSLFTFVTHSRSLHSPHSPSSAPFNSFASLTYSLMHHS